ncbi:MAG: Hsp70 family protein [Deltaproteobacteria bacterium]|nr:Hsp70 family protein [Deltaproteobacteria bacterium]
MTTTQEKKNYAVGIDLGTTNTAVGCVDVDDEKASPAVFSLPQVVAAQESRELNLLPSFLYQPAASELPAGALALPWDPARAFAVGAFARDRAGSVPGRVIASAKSWLVHPGVDRRAAILPFGAAADSDVPKLSPVDVQARLLAHVREAWDHAHPDAPLAQQQVVLTVPASFDVVARTLTEEAAVAAGLPSCVLLEEPQAALYAWIAFHGDLWRKQVAPGDQILVVDVGGGTTDFSLIAVTDDGAGNLSLERKAVGDHILLGGDNMDLALAWRVKLRLEGEGKTVDDWQLRALTHSCREAKEAMLEDASIGERTVVIPGRGSKLIGGSIKASLTRAELEESLVEGFFPVVDADARPMKSKRAGLQTLGLPYASDAAITRHLAAFLNGQKPTALLFNGGVTRSPVLQKRIVDVINGWVPAVRVLEGADLDLAVAKGAASFARVRSNKRGLRIKGGAARAYYVGFEKSELAVPGMAPRFDAVCIAPQGMEEGSEAAIATELGLVVGEPAQFRFFASSKRKEDAAGAVVDVTKAGDELIEVAPIETTLVGTPGALVPVTLHSRVTELGTLELSAVETATQAKHKLEFSIRGDET